MKTALKLLLLWLLVAVAQARGARFGVVLSVRGEVRLNQKLPVKVLSSIACEDVIAVPAGARLTLSILASGRRYTIEGPAQVTVTRGRELQPQNRVLEEPAPAGRKCIVASHALDLSKLGGSSGRSAGATLFTDRPELSFDGELWQAANLPSEFVVSYRDAAGGPVRRCRGRRQGSTHVRLDGAELKPGHRYEIWPEKGNARLSVYFLSDRELGPVQALRKLCRTPEDQVELLEVYRKLRLFERALQLVESLSGAFPQESLQELRQDILRQGREFSLTR